MKLTKSRLQRIIKEELQAVLQETGPYQDQHPGSGCDPSVQTCVGPSVELGSEFDYGGKTADVVRSYQAGQSADMSGHANQTLTTDFQTLLAHANEAGDAMDPGMRQHMHDLGQELLVRGYAANLVNAQYKTFGINQQQPQYKMRLRRFPGEDPWDPIQEGQKEKYLAKLVREELAAVLQEEEQKSSEEATPTPAKAPPPVTSHPPLVKKDPARPKYPPDYQKSTQVQAPVKKPTVVIPKHVYTKKGKHYAVTKASELEKAFPRKENESNSAYKHRVSKQIKRQERQR